MKSNASAFVLNVLDAFGNNITGTIDVWSSNIPFCVAAHCWSSIVSWISSTVFWTDVLSVVEPPINIKSVPDSIAIWTILEDSSGVCFSGSIKVAWQGLFWFVKYSNVLLYSSKIIKSPPLFHCFIC